MYAYYRIYMKFLDYHEVLLEEFKDIYTPRDVRLVRHANSEVRTFFAMIVCMVLIQTVYLGTLAIETLTVHKVSDRLHAVMTVILNVAYIVLYVGISQSADKSFKACHKQETLLSSEDNLQHLPFFGGKADEGDSVLGDDLKFRHNSIFVDENSDVDDKTAKESLRKATFTALD